MFHTEGKDLTRESLVKSSVMASWHVYHRKFGRFHSSDKSRYNQHSTVCLNFFPFHPLPFACVCMHASLSMGETEWMDRRKESWNLPWRIEGEKDCCDSGGGTASTTVRRWERAEEKKASGQEAVCDNLVEETGLCAQHCLETENIFYSEDLVWIIQVKWSDLS